MKQQAWIMMAFALVAAQQWADAQPGGGKPGGGNAGGGNAGGGNAGGGNGSGGTNTVRRVQPNNGYTKGMANYGVNTITIGGRNTRTITARIMVQDFSKRGARILLRSKRWGGEEYPYKVLSGRNTGGGNTGGGNTGGGTNTGPQPIGFW